MGQVLVPSQVRARPPIRFPSGEQSAPPRCSPTCDHQPGRHLHRHSESLWRREGHHRQIAQQGVKGSFPGLRYKRDYNVYDSKALWFGRDLSAQEKVQGSLPRNLQGVSRFLVERNALINRRLAFKRLLAAAMLVSHAGLGWTQDTTKPEIKRSQAKAADVDLVAVGHLGLLALAPDREGRDAADDLALGLGELVGSSEVRRHQVHDVLETGVVAGDRLDGRAGSAEEHSQFAREREEDVKRERDEVRKQFRKLKAQIAAGAPKEKLAETSAKVDTALRNFSTANNALASAIREPAFRPWMDDVTDRSGTPLPARVSATLPSEKK